MKEAQTILKKTYFENGQLRSEGMIILERNMVNGGIILRRA